MTFTNNNLTNITDQEFELEALKEQSEILNFMTKHDIAIPENINPKYNVLLKSFISMIKHYVEIEIIDETEILWYYQEFLKVPDDLKSKCMSQLLDTFELKIHENLDIETLFVTEKTDRDAKEIASKLSPELRDAFYYYINTGEFLTPEIRSAVDEELAAISEGEALDRLERAFDEKQTLNIGLRQTPKGRALTPEEVAAKFGLDDSIAADEAEVQQAEDKDPLNKAGIKTQSLYELVKVNRERLSSEEAKNKKKVEYEEELVLKPVEAPKLKGLDDLLDK
jgi:hypothetical protein